MYLKKHLNRKLVIILIIMFGFLSELQISYSENDSLKTVQTDTTTKSAKEMIKSPTGAVLRSLALPGWGQYYVESYWKVPIILAGYGTVVFFIIDNNSKYKTAANEFANYIGTDATEKDYLYRKREYFRDYRDMNILYLAGIYLISCVDAYVGANLYEFNVDDKLTLNYHTGLFGNPEVGLKVKF